jgi:hypothetical protein
VDGLKVDMVLFVCTSKTHMGMSRFWALKCMEVAFVIFWILNVTHAWGLMFLVGDGSIKNWLWKTKYICKKIKRIINTKLMWKWMFILGWTWCMHWSEGKKII